MNNITLDLGENTKALIEQFCASAGTTIETLLPLYAKQLIVQGILIIIAVIVVLYSLFHIRHNLKIKYGEEDAEGYVVLCTFACGLVSIASLFFLVGAISTILNADLCAIKALLADIERLK